MFLLLDFPVVFVMNGFQSKARRQCDIKDVRGKIDAIMIIDSWTVSDDMLLLYELP